MSCKQKTKSLRAANGVPGTVHMLNGGDLLMLRSHKEPLLDPAADQQKMLASMQDNGGPDQAQQMMQGVMQNVGSSGAPGTGAGLFETGVGMRQTMNQGMSNASALQRGLGTSGSTVPTGGALGPAPQDPRMSGRPSGLQMADGGEVSPYSIKGIGRSMGFFKTPDEQRAAAVAKVDAEQAAYRARQAQLPATQQAPAQGGISGYVGNSALDGRMKAAGLRDGGDLRTGHGGAVPGTGHGDKIPAKYEPGEFVVSNDMLDAEPELLGHLRGLRKAVLAAKGTTPEAADAQALGSRGLRAHA